MGEFAVNFNFLSSPFERSAMKNENFFFLSSSQPEKCLCFYSIHLKRVYNVAQYFLNFEFRLAGKVASIESLQHNFTNEPAKEGKRVKITCKVNGEPAPKVTWFKDGRSINRNKTKFEFVVTR